MSEELAHHGYKISPVPCIRHCAVSKSADFSNPNFVFSEGRSRRVYPPPRLVR